MHAIRRNLNLTLLVHNNKVYGLTKGQASPTSDLGMVTKLQQQGVISEAFNPLAVAIALGAGFVSRSFSGRKEHLSGLIQQAVEYQGFSLIDILQPCVSFNRQNTYAWYDKRVYDLNEDGYTPDEIGPAMTRAFEWGDKIPIGIFYKKDRPSFTGRIATLQQGPLISQTRDFKKLNALLSKP